MVISFKDSDGSFRVPSRIVFLAVLTMVCAALAFLTSCTAEQVTTFQDSVNAQLAAMQNDIEEAQPLIGLLGTIFGPTGAAVGAGVIGVGGIIARMVYKKKKKDEETTPTPSPQT